MKLIVDQGKFDEDKKYFKKIENYKMTQII